MKVKSNKRIYVGDICYALKDEIYDEIWGDKNGYEDGIFEVENGISFAVGRTAFGDGYFVGSDNNTYYVDAGVIGVVPEELWKDETDAELNRLGRILDVKEVEFFASGVKNKNFRENGIFEIIYKGGSISIDTANFDEEEEEE